MFRAIWKWVVRSWESLGWYFRPTVWVQPNMQARFIKYLEMTRTLHELDRKRDPGAEALRDEMDPLWLELSDHEREILDSGKLPYATTQEAVDALPHRGGTILCGAGVQYIFEPIIFADKNIRLIGGEFCSAGTCIELRSGHAAIIGCVFNAYEGGPREWSPRGEPPEDGSGGTLIQVNLDP